MWDMCAEQGRAGNTKQLEKLLKLEIVKEDISFPSSYEAAMKCPEPPPWYTRVSINLDIYIFAGKPKHSLVRTLYASQN